MDNVIQLFKRLEETVGNTSKAAEICGLERKTIYGWEEAGEIKLKTKKKILAALIEYLTEETLDFIVQRSAEASTDVLRIYLTALYEKAMDINTAKNEILRLISRYNLIKQKYAGLIVNYLEFEVGNMLHNIQERANELGIHFVPSPNDIVRLEEFSLLIPNLIKTISTSPYTPDSEIAKTFNVSQGFIHSFSTALHENYIAIKSIAIPDGAGSLPTDGQIAATVTPHTRAKYGIWTKQFAPERGLPIQGGTT